VIANPIDALDATYIAELVANGVPESRSLDYKEQLPGRADQDHAEFLADVASFANALGGHIVYGVSEQRDADGRPTGVPSAVVGIAGNIDAEVLRLENMARTSIDPRVPTLRFRPIRGGPTGDVLVCWVPKSWQAPHMVTFRGASRFYARGASGKYQMDVRQIRDAFTATENLREAIRRFRAERLARIVSAEASPTGRFFAPAQIVLQVIPVSTFDPVGPAKEVLDMSTAAPKALDGQPHHNRRFNFDGVLGWTSAQDGRCVQYTQVFRNGVIEDVDASTLRREDQVIPSTTFEERVIGAVRRHLADLARWGVTGPFLIMLTLLNVKGYRMGLAVDLWNEADATPIDRDMIIVSELLLDTVPPDQDVPQLLRGTLDIVWQSAGFAGSPNFR
jgi:hypothetical protein